MATTLSGSRKALPVPWQAFPEATELRIIDSDITDSWTRYDANKLKEADLKRYLQLLQDLPDRVVSLAIKEIASVAHEQAKQLAQALATSAPTAAGVLRTLELGISLNDAAARSLLTSMPSLRNLAMAIEGERVEIGQSPGKKLVKMKVPQQLETLRLRTPCYRYAARVAFTKNGSGSSALRELHTSNLHLSGLKHLAGLEVLSATSAHQDIFVLEDAEPFVRGADLEELVNARDITLHQHCCPDTWDALASLPKLDTLSVWGINMGFEVPPAAEQVTSLKVSAFMDIHRIPEDEQEGAISAMFPALQTAVFGDLPQQLPAVVQGLQGHSALQQLTLQRPNYDEWEPEEGEWPDSSPLSSIPGLTALTINASINEGFGDLVQDVCGCSKLQQLALRTGDCDEEEAIEQLVEELLPSAAFAAGLRRFRLCSDFSSALSAEQIVQVVQALPELEWAELEWQVCGVQSRAAWAQLLAKQLRQAGLPVVGVAAEPSKAAEPGAWWASSRCCCFVVKEKGGVRRLRCWAKL